MSRMPVALPIVALFCSVAQAQLAPGSWQTDLSKHSIDLTELVRAGKKDSVASVDHPKFVPPEEASKWLNAKEPVIVVELNGEARAYPIQILIWHLMVNDQIGETPVLVSYSVFCQSASVFDRRLNGAAREFGFAGMMRNSNLVMFDRESDSLWQQLTGESIAGVMTGAALPMLKSQVAPFDVFSRSYPNGKVLSQDTGFTRKYGQNPYAHYLSDGKLRFPVKLGTAMPVGAMEEMIAVRTGKAIRGYPDSVLSGHHVFEDKAGDQKFVILSDNTMLSARDSLEITQSGKEIAAGVFSPALDGKNLSFRYRGGAFTDKQTGSEWNLLGTCVKGPLAGKHLKPMAHMQALAFAWLAFHPETEVITVPGVIVPEMAEPLDPNTNPDSRRQSSRPNPANPNPPNPNIPPL